MPKIMITRGGFLEDRQGRRFADVAGDEGKLFDEVLKFFSDENRQQRMEDSELHHDRAPLAGVVRELESLPDVHQAFLAGDPSRSKRLRQAIGVVVRIIMEGRGWRKTGRKGSLGVRAPSSPESPNHNSGGLALFFLRAERYQRGEGMPYRTVRDRSSEMIPADEAKTRNGRKRHGRAPSGRNSQQRR